MGGAAASGGGGRPAGIATHTDGRWEGGKAHQSHLKMIPAATAAVALSSSLPGAMVMEARRPLLACAALNTATAQCRKVNALAIDAENATMGRTANSSVLGGPPGAPFYPLRLS